MSRSRLAAVGAFVIAGLLLFAVGIFMIGDRRLLFTEHFELFAEFDDLTGVRAGSKVRVSGIDAGEVLEIQIPPSPVLRFRIKMRVREDLHPLVRADSVAAIMTEGLVGNAFIQIREGTGAAPAVPDGGSIEGVSAVSISDLIQEGRETFETIATQATDVKEQVNVTLQALQETLDGANQLVAEVGPDIRRITNTTARFMDHAEIIADDTKQIVEDLKAGRGTVGQLLRNDALYDRAVGAAEETEATIRTVRETVDDARSALEDFRTGGDGEGARPGSLFADIRQTVALAREAVTNVVENTEALKHNFLFRGFFTRRGFFNLDSMTLAEYREFAQRERHAPLRIWLDADVLFETGPNGDERLTEAGQKRIDSAMGQFVQYPRDSALMVEGYATAGPRSQQFLTAQRRASLVRGYLVSRFERPGNLTGMIPIGSEAPESPRPDRRWAGVALTLFVATEALAARAADGDNEQ